MSHDAFLRSILADLDNDTPRLVYADWLEEHDQPEWAEFIRIECEQARIHKDPEVAPNRWDNPRYWELEDRRELLYDRHAATWFAPLFRIFRGEMSTRRGFPDLLALTARQFIDKAEAAFRAAPTIEDVFIDRLGQNMPRLAQCPALGHVRKLTFFETPFRATEAEAFARSPYLGNLREFEIPFTDTQIGPRGALALANAPTLIRLEHLDLYNHGIGNAGAIALIQAPHLRTLKKFRLGDNDLTDETLVALAHADQLALTSLDLASNPVTGEGVAALGKATHLAGLTHLFLFDSQIGPHEATTFVEARFAPTLQTLHVVRCHFEDQDLATLFGGDFPNLRVFWAGSNFLGERAARALAGNNRLIHLEKLMIDWCGINAKTAKLLATVSLPALRSLEIAYNPLRSTGVRRLLAGPLVRALTRLDLERTELGDVGAKEVARSLNVANVRWLQLGANQITDPGAIALAESPHLEEVQLLDLTENDIGSKGQTALTERFGDRVRIPAGST